MEMEKREREIAATFEVFLGPSGEGQRAALKKLSRKEDVTLRGFKTLFSSRVEAMVREIISNQNTLRYDPKQLALLVYGLEISNRDICAYFLSVLKSFLGDDRAERAIGSCIAKQLYILQDYDGLLELAYSDGNTIRFWALLFLHRSPKRYPLITEHRKLIDRETSKDYDDSLGSRFSFLCDMADEGPEEDMVKAQFFSCFREHRQSEIRGPSLKKVYKYRELGVLKT